MRLDPAERRLAWSLGLALLAYYLLILGGHQYSSDGIVIFQSAKALVFQGSFVLSPPVVFQGEFAVNRWGIGMTLAYVPFLLLWSPLLIGVPALRAIPYDPTHYANPALYANIPYLLCSGLNPLVTAATAAAVFALGRLVRLDRGWAAAAALAYGLASPAAPYARYDFPQPLAALALTATVWGLVRADGSAAVRPLAWAGASLGYGVLTRSELILLAPWIAGWVFLRARAAGWRAAGRRAAIVTAPIGAAVLVHLVVNWLRFGNLTRTGYPLPSWSPVEWRGSPLEGLIGLLVSPGKGLLLFFPLAWLALPGLIRLARSGLGLGSLLPGLLGLLFLVYGSTPLWDPRGDPPEWGGGTSWGPRYLVTMLPILSLAAAAWAGARDAGRGRRLAFAVLAALGAVVSWNGILFDFVAHYRWVYGTLGFPWTSATYFQTAASPLVSGWTSPARAWDLFWLLDPDLVPPLRELQRQAQLHLGIDPSALGRPWGLLIPALLLGVLAWAARCARAAITR